MGAKAPIKESTKLTTTVVLKLFVCSPRIAWTRRSAVVSGSTEPKSVPQYRQRRAMDLIVSPQAGHFFVSPQAESGVCTDCSDLSIAGALLQPYVPQPPISVQHSWWWICWQPGQVTQSSDSPIVVWQMGQT